MSTKRNRLSQKSIYGPLTQKTLKNLLKKELITNFGFENMNIIADTLVDRFLKIINDCSLEKERIKPYQTIVFAVDKHQRLGYGKTMNQTKLIPVTINIITHEELMELSSGKYLKDLRSKIVARILKEAYSQGGVLSFNDVAVICGVPSTTIKRAVRKYYEQHPDEVLPHIGTIFDSGSTLTHKRKIIKLHLSGLLTKEISMRTNHHPLNVDNYISSFEQIRGLHKEGKSIQQISFFTKFSQSLVKEYIQIIKELKQIQSNNANKANTTVRCSYSN